MKRNLYFVKLHQLPVANISQSINHIESGEMWSREGGGAVKDLCVYPQSDIQVQGKTI